MTNEILTQHRETEVMNTITPVIISGLPGKMATLVAEAVSQESHYPLLDVAMTSARHRRTTQILNGNQRVNLIDYCPFDLTPGTIAIDYTSPRSAETNAISYTHLRVPFVMGTTGGNRDAIEQAVRESNISAVIAPNMCMDVVARQMRIDEIGQLNPDFFMGSRVRIRESHQKTKRDVSGTALALKAQFESLGAEVAPIESIRDTEFQKSIGIPDPDAGHGYHWVWVTNPEGEQIYRFQTRINGRQPYVDGTLAALDFLSRKMREGSRGEVFTMRDVVAERRAA